MKTEIINKLKKCIDDIIIYTRGAEKEAQIWANAIYINELLDIEAQKNELQRKGYNVTRFHTQTTKDTERRK